MAGGGGEGRAARGVTSSAATMRTSRRISTWLAFGVFVLGLQEVPGQRSPAGNGGIGNSGATEEDLNSVLCMEDGTDAHYEEFLRYSQKARK